MDNDKYVYELEQALTRLLEFFEPTTGGDCRYILYNDEGDPVIVDNEELDDALDHANEIMYGESLEEDD